MQLTPYLNFDGQCRQALEFYSRVLGGRIAMSVTYGESPMAGQAPPDWILHATFEARGQTLGAADAPPGTYSKPQGLSITIGLADDGEAERIYTALAEGATVHVPLQETFWASRFAMLVDRFGTPWMINCERSGVRNGSGDERRSDTEPRPRGSGT
jgi:PhnB protein